MPEYHRLPLTPHGLPMIATNTLTHKKTVRCLHSLCYFARFARSEAHHVGGEDQHPLMLATGPLRIAQQVGVVVTQIIHT